MHFMSSAKVCNEEARCNAVNESVLVWTNNFSHG